MIKVLLFLLFFIYIYIYFSGKGGTNKDLYEISLEFEKEVNPQVIS